jgi:hypothetical protein
VHVLDASAASSDGGLPHRLWIGVTGHRDLGDEETVLGQVRAALEELTRKVGPDTPLGVVSPLAEGADRLVAREVMARADAVLELALPMSTQDYLADFRSEESRAEFMAMRDHAALVTVTSSPERDDAYAEVGHYVVARCDVLLAIWDRQLARGWGGTAQIVELAEKRHVPTCRIRADGSGREWVGLETLDRGTSVDRFNREPLPEAAVRQQSSRVRTQLVSAAEVSGLSGEELEPYLSWVVPHLVRADLLAAKYQRLYRHAGSWLFAGSFAAVAVAAYQALFRPELVELVWLEAFAMASLLVVLFVARNRQLHQRWLGYRSLAEQFRAGMFRAVAGMGQVRSEPGSAGREQPDAWVPRLFDELWMVRPTDALPAPKLADFVGTAWLDDQIAYNHVARERNKRRDEALRLSVAFLFAATLVVAVAHAAEINEGAHHWLELSSILLPAAGAALHGVRSQRDYVRNAERAEQLLAGLEHLRFRLRSEASEAQVKAVVAEASRLMLAENREWFGLMRHHDLEIQV